MSPCPTFGEPFLFDFDTLFSLLEQGLPVINVTTCFRDTLAWEANYHDDERCVFLEQLTHAVTIVAQRDGHELKGSYRIANLDRAHVRATFEDELIYGLDGQEIGYTDRDRELIAEYFANAKATPIAP